jgi:hypothetical protein
MKILIKHVPEAFCYFLALFFNCLMLKMKMLQFFENIVTIYQYFRIGLAHHLGAL